MPVLASGKTRTGRLWTYVRDDKPFAGRAALAAMFYYSPDRGGEHPKTHLADYSGLMQADAYAGFNLERWMRQERRRLSSRSPLAKAMEYSLKRWPALTRFLEDGRICMTNNAAERAVRGIAMGRKNWTFAGSDSGGRRAAAIYTLIETCKLNDIDPRAWLADVPARVADHPAKRIAELLPWNWRSTVAARAA